MRVFRTTQAYIVFRTAFNRSALSRRGGQTIHRIVCQSARSIPQTCCINKKKHLREMFFLFGTPIGNRTLVSAVRGRRLEPLDHEGKMILLCDNITVLRLMQAKIRIFQKSGEELLSFLCADAQNAPPIKKVKPARLNIATIR